MPQIYFVDPCNEDRLEKQRRLSHAALISHRHRRLKNGSQTLAYRQREPKNRTRTEENRTINVEYDDGFFPWMSNGGAVTVSGNVTQRSEDDEGRQQDSVQEIVIRHLLSLFPHRRHKELAAPLALGKYASAEAHEGKNFFNVFAEDAQSLERIIYDPFSISRSGGFKEDSIEILANDVVFHAYYALAQAKREMRNQPNAAPSAHLLQHKGQALVKLQNWFKQKDVYEARREAITAMMLLTAVELFRGSQSSFKTHREAMGKLVVATGGFDSLIPKQQFALCELEMLWAIFTGTLWSTTSRNLGSGISGAGLRILKGTTCQKGSGLWLWKGSCQERQWTTSPGSLGSLERSLKTTTLRSGEEGLIITGRHSPAFTSTTREN